VNPLYSTGNYNPGILKNPTAYGLSASLPQSVKCAIDNKSDCAPQGVNFADPYYGGRGPQFINYNFGIQRMINKKAVLSINYAGSQTHFLNGGTGRGLARNAISPDYGPELREYTYEPAQGEYNVVHPILPNYTVPNFPGGFTGQDASVTASLTAFPQFSTSTNGGGLTDVWGETGNSSNNSLQILVTQRPWHNLSGFADYTRSKEIDDTGSHRTWYPLGPQDGNFTKFIPANKVDRGLGSNNQTNLANVTFVYLLPIGRGQAFGSTNRYVSAIGGGWQISGIYQYQDGNPIQINGNSPNCNPTTNEGQVGNTCQPDLTPGFNKSQVRINGRWGRGPGANAITLGQIQYVNPGAFICPDAPLNNPQVTCGTSQNQGSSFTFKIGNAPRSAPDNLTGPGWWNINMGIRRTFQVRETASLHLTFEFEADVSNLTNSTFFTATNNNWAYGNGTGFGTVSQQNANVPPRDWQFSGRFRF
jgi:hypothetical protein